MKILILSRSDIKGGAAIVAHQLATGLIAKGHNVSMHVTYKSGKDDFAQQIKNTSKPPNIYIQKIIHRLGLNSLNLNSDFPRSLTRTFIESFDIVHLHDLPSQFNYYQLPWLTAIRPTVWTPHSMNPFTGGCAYSFDCHRWKTSCGKCPQFGKFPLHWIHRDGSYAINRIKRHIYRKSRLNIVTVSQWLKEQVEQSMLRQQKVHCILNPVDTEIYYPIDKAQAKTKLGIPPNRKTILFALASNLQDKRKGVETILKALPLLKTKDIYLIPTAVTTLTDEFKTCFKTFETLPPKHIADTKEMALYYNAADLVWHPTLADTSSLVSLEALACGTPVLASKVGGVQEIVQDSINGFHVPPKDPKRLAEKTDAFFTDDKMRAKLSSNAPDSLDRYQYPRFIDEHLDLYESLTQMHHLG